ncbi:MAG: manganese efflux pump [Sedimentisphaerales bacterium]|nr:manganese efflux pump [Sedimentisphaerales bacterium]
MFRPTVAQLVLASAKPASASRRHDGQGEAGSSIVERLRLKRELFGYCKVGFVTITIIAVGLAMDAFAVSIVEGGTYQKLHVKHAFRIAFLFGAFQAFMPIAGYFCGVAVKQYIVGFDHWVAFGLLSFIGAKMIYESVKIKSSSQNRQSSGIVLLLGLSVATSIDALAVGVTLGIVQSSIAAAAVIIGMVTFILSYAGVYIGQRIGHFFENKIEAVGGLVLIGIGIKILLEHLL